MLLELFLPFGGRLILGLGHVIDTHVAPDCSLCAEQANLPSEHPPASYLCSNLIHKPLGSFLKRHEGTLLEALS
jgi:hypothetical protein